MTTNPSDVTPTIIDEAGAEKIAEAMNRMRPLDQAQKQNLQEILDVDHRRLSTRIQGAYTDALQRVNDAITAESTLGEEIDDTIAEAKRIKRKYSKARKRLIKQAKAQGIVLEMPSFDREEWEHEDHYIDHSIQAYSDKLRKDINEAQKPVVEAFQKAQELLREQRSTALRQILLASISQDAETVLRLLPSEEDLLAAFAALNPAVLEAPVKKAVAAKKAPAKRTAKKA